MATIIVVTTGYFLSRRDDGTYCRFQDNFTPPRYAPLPALCHSSRAALTNRHNAAEAGAFNPGAVATRLLALPTTPLMWRHTPAMPEIYYRHAIYRLMLLDKK